MVPLSSILSVLLPYSQIPNTVLGWCAIYFLILNRSDSIESFFGMFPVAYCADRFGRRITIQLGAAVYMFVFDLVSITTIFLTSELNQLGGRTTNRSNQHGHDASWTLFRR